MGAVTQFQLKMGLTRLKRLDENLLNGLIGESEAYRNDWLQFFGNANVSSRPKFLKYARILTSERNLMFILDAPSKFGERGFSGERQADENQAVIDILRKENLWKTTIENAASCYHTVPKVLQSLSLIEGLSYITRAAEQEHQEGNDNWHQRLWALIRGLPVSSVDELPNDAAFCRGGSPGGHSIPAGSYLRRQLDQYQWLPSSQGPASSSNCFLRLSSRRLISSGSANEELGDKLLPYVAVDNLEDLTRLQHLGVELLDDVDSASASALMRALNQLGDRLSTQWGKREIVEVRGRWRLVRGAIQEIYRALNQKQTLVDVPPDINFVIRSVSGVDFSPGPIYYAEPGSPVERAFLGILRLLDADRPYPRLFEHMGITRLIPNHTVTEKLLTKEGSVPATRLYGEIVDNLAPYLLATIIARSDRPKDSDLILRRLRGRFEIRAVSQLAVSFSLIDDVSVEKIVDFSKFYLQRRISPGPGAVQEAHYTLYVKGGDSTSLSILDLDADALGESLGPLFSDGMGEDLTLLFPRITSRYHHMRGNRNAMQEFMHYQLGISDEAQDMAWAMVSGESIETPRIPIRPPPAIPIQPITNSEGSPESEQNIESTIRRHEETLTEITRNFVSNLAIVASKNDQTQQTGTGAGSNLSIGKGKEITPEQEARGKRGEEEIKRRLQLPGGWEGFILIRDTREQGCGYDFLCAMSDREVKLEVKTFTPDGRVVVTSRELQEAAASQDDYFLIGVLDDGKPEYKWSTFYIRNPIRALLTKGAFDIQAKLQASAVDVFDLDKSNQ